MDSIHPEHYFKLLKDLWQEAQLDEQKASGLSGQIKLISDHFIHAKNRSTPWNEKNLIAYASYFGLLNYVRVEHAIRRILQKTPQHDFNFDEIVEWGSGLGASHLALQSFAQTKKWHFVENSILAQDFHRKILKTSKTNVQQHAWSTQLNHSDISHRSLFFSCYALNENTPSLNWKKFDALLIIEPSTFEFSQNLIQFRQDRLSDGFIVHSPCTHQNNCPMQNLKNYWCHDRAHWTRPAWFQAIESRIGIQSHTLPYSYLYMVKPERLTESFAAKTRIVGDELIEKGKTRWSICNENGLQRLSYLHRHGTPPPLKRGDLIDLNAFTTEPRGDEIRFR